MNLAGINHQSLSTQLDKPVTEVMVVVAKHRVAGVGLESLAETIGCAVADLEELESDPVYIEVRGVIGALTASANADQGLLWDSIEQVAAKKLLARTETERDTDTLLRIAATANRMTRRVTSARQPLDPGVQGRKVSIQLTRRMVERLTSDGASVRASEDSVSIHGGSMSNPDFEEVNQLLGLQPAKIAAHADAQILAELGFE